MLTLISPAKKLLSVAQPYAGTTTLPLFHTETERLVRIMKKKSSNEIAQLMDLSPDLAQLNFERYQQFHDYPAPRESTYPALLFFQGDVYQGLQAKTFSEADLQYAQEHSAILSGLYGLLKPLDLIQPYRLEMGTRLENPKGANLYHFWGETVTQYLNKLLATHANPVLINLASTEYFKVVQEKQIKHPIITINFYERKNSELKMIGIYAKKARGVMAKFLIQNRIDTVAQIKEFNELGYFFSEETSADNHLDFIRAC